MAKLCLVHTSANASGVWTYTTAGLPSGDHVFRATATNSVGNTSAFSNSLDANVDPGPVVDLIVASGSGITSGSGDVTTGDVVTLTLNMSENVTVVGSIPTLTLSDGVLVTYAGRVRQQRADL